MSIRMFMLLMFLAIGLLYLVGIGLDWSPDISREEWSEMHGGPSKESLEAMRQFQAEQLAEMQGQQRQVMGDQAILQDMARSMQLAEANDEGAAVELVGLLQKYGSSARRPPRPGSDPELHRQAGEVITQAVAESRNPHLFNALMASQKRSSDPKYRAHVAEVLARRKDPEALTAVLNIAAKAGYSSDSQRSDVVALGRALGRFPQADRVEAGRAYLASSDYREKAFGIELLGDIKSPEAAEILLEHFGGDGMGGHWQQLIAAVGRIGLPALGPLQAYIANPQSPSREWAARSLEKIDDPAVAGVMIELLADEDVMVASVARGYFSSMSYRQEFRDKRHREQQRKAAQAQAAQPEPQKPRRLKLVAEGESPAAESPVDASVEEAAMAEAPEPLLPLDAEARKLTTIMLKASRHENPVVRRTAVDILARQRDPRSYGALLQACLDPDPSVQRQAAIAVGAGNYNSQFEPARQLAKYVKASSAGQKAMAAGGLHHLAPEPLLDVLGRAYREESSFKPEAAAMFVRVAGPGQAPIYFEMLASPNDRISNTGRRALWRHIRPEHADGLNKTAASPHRHVRSNTLSLLRRLGPPHAIEPLLTMLHRDPNYPLRDQAGQILARYDDLRLVRPLYEWIWTCRTDENRARRWRDAEVVLTGLEEDPSWALAEFESHEDPRRRAYAGGWLVRIERDDVRKAVLHRLEAGDAMLARETYSHLAPDELKQFEALLIKALDEEGWPRNSLSMAQYFLNCGNETLRDAAVAWAGRNGYRVIYYWVSG